MLVIFSLTTIISYLARKPHILLYVILDWSVEYNIMRYFPFKYTFLKNPKLISSNCVYLVLFLFFLSHFILYSYYYTSVYVCKHKTIFYILSGCLTLFLYWGTRWRSGETTCLFPGSNLARTSHVHPAVKGYPISDSAVLSEW